jgi:heme exporter protein B
MGRSVRAAWAIYRKDLRVELRTRETVGSVLVFAVVTAFIFNFAFDPSPQVLGLVAPGIVWVAYVFTGMLGLNRSFQLERDRSTLELLLLAPAGREAIYWGKLAGALTVMLVVEALMAPVFLFLYDLSLFSPLLAATAVLATVGFAAVGTLFAAIAVHTRSREVLLPVLFLPLAMPVIVGAVGATTALLAGGGLAQVNPWFQLMAAFDVATLVVSSWAFEHVLEE